MFHFSFENGNFTFPHVFNITGSFRVSIVIELGCTGDLGMGWWGDIGTFMINRPILQGSVWWKLNLYNGANEYEACKGMRHTMV